MVQTRSAARNAQEFVKELGIEFPVDPEEVDFERFLLFDRQQLKCFGFSEGHCDKILHALTTLKKPEKKSRIARALKPVMKPYTRTNNPEVAVVPQLAAPVVLGTPADADALLADPALFGQMEQLIDCLPAPFPQARHKANSEEHDVLLAAFIGDTRGFEAAIGNDPKAINKKNADGWTSLHYALAIGCTEVAVKLVDAGASLDARTRDGDTPVDLGAKWGHRATLRATLTKAEEMHGKAKVEALLTRRSKSGRQPLHYAVEARHHDASMVLMLHGADANARDDAGCTPLHVACSTGDINTIEQLLRKHTPNSKVGDLHLKNNDGRTPHDLFPKDKKLLAELLKKLAAPK
ncbi:Beta-N-acetylhexosaminidase [Aphelenchoides fujianensis]|nr:Beta-N-acetylhexosaminidase [Aphelenchoides fujianensis]